MRPLPARADLKTDVYVSPRFEPRPAQSTPRVSVRAVACPQCGAPVGASCVTAAGKAKTSPCRARHRMAVRAAREA